MQASAAQSWLKVRRSQASLHAVNALIFAVPNVLRTPIFWMLGFIDRGPRPCTRL